MGRVAKERAVPSCIVCSADTEPGQSICSACGGTPASGGAHEDDRRARLSAAVESERSSGDNTSEFNIVDPADARRRRSLDDTIVLRTVEAKDGDEDDDTFDLAQRSGDAAGELVSRFLSTLPERASGSMADAPEREVDDASAAGNGRVPPAPADGRDVTTGPLPGPPPQDRGGPAVGDPPASRVNGRHPALDPGPPADRPAPASTGHAAPRTDERPPERRTALPAPSGSTPAADAPRTSAPPATADGASPSEPPTAAVATATGDDASDSGSRWRATFDNLGGWVTVIQSGLIGIGLLFLVEVIILIIVEENLARANAGRADPSQAIAVHEQATGGMLLALVVAAIVATAIAVWWVIDDDDAQGATQRWRLLLGLPRAVWLVLFFVGILLGVSMAADSTTVGQAQRVNELYIGACAALMVSSVLVARGLASRHAGG